MPDAVVRRAAGSVKPELRGLGARNACGIWMRMPAPSPVFFSAPTAPRCSRFTSTVSALRDDVVRRAPLDVDDEAEAAGVVLVRGVVQPLLLGIPGLDHLPFVLGERRSRSRAGGPPGGHTRWM